VKISQKVLGEATFFDSHCSTRLTLIYGTMMSKYRNLKTYHECSKCFCEFPESDQQQFMMPIIKREPRT